MFQSISSTAFPPDVKPLLIWDGNCGFCNYWVIRLKTIVKGNIDFSPYQDVYQKFPDIPLKFFEEASRLIDIHGEIYSGPDSFYKALCFKPDPIRVYHSFYKKCPPLKMLSDSFYEIIAANRSTMFKITTALFGKNPLRLRPYWAIYLLILAFTIALLS